MAIMMFAQGQPLGGIILLLFCALSLCWWYVVQDRIKLAANMLIIASTFIRHHCSLVFVSLITLLLSVGWITLWAVTMYCTLMKTGAIEKNADGSTTSNKAGFGVMFYFFLTYFWGITVLSNTLHVTTSGAFAEWFLIPDGSNQTRLGVITLGSQYKVFNSLYRALTTSFGSICYGSFLISVVRALKACIRKESEDSDNLFAVFLACIAQCILSCIEDIMEFMNTYAYVHVAIYGEDFCSSGYRAWNLILGVGWDVVINDDITGTALVFSALGGGVMAGFLTYGLAYVSMDVDSSTSIALGITGGLIAFGCMFLIMSLANSIVACIFVLYCEKPTEVQQTRPEEFGTLVEGWREIYGTDDYGYTDMGGYFVLPETQPQQRRQA